MIPSELPNRRDFIGPNTYRMAILYHNSMLCIAQTKTLTRIKNTVRVFIKSSEALFYFYDVVVGNNKASDLIKKWRDNVWVADTGLKSPNDYKKDSKLNVHNFDITSTIVWVLHGSWPQTIKEGDLTYTATEIKIIDVTIAYDWADLEGSDYNTQTGQSYGTGTAA